MEYSEDGEYVWDGEHWSPVENSALPNPESLEPIQYTKSITEHYFEWQDSIYIGISVLIPVIMMFYLIPNFDSTDPFANYEGELASILLIIGSFLPIGYAYSLRRRSFAQGPLILAATGVSCLLWIIFAYGPWEYYLLLTVFVMGCLAANIYMSKVRDFLPVISIFVLWQLLQQPGSQIWSISGSNSFLASMWHDYNPPFEDWSMGSRSLFSTYNGIFFFIALATSFLTGDSIKSKPITDGYVPIRDAALAVLPALALILFSLGVGTIIASASGTFEGIMIGASFAIVGMVIGQFKLLADVINRGIRTSKK
jgi:hypothetical protein|tara:strand:- start:448 stop:1380 length:933 start_codon:yes stop_codon:yes gene_type:complete